MKNKKKLFLGDFIEKKFLSMSWSAGGIKYDLSQGEIRRKIRRQRERERERLNNL